MIALPQDLVVRELIVSGAILVGSYLGARMLSFILGKSLSRAARRTATTLDDRLIQALERPVTYALFLIGAYVAVHRLPIEMAWVGRMDQLVFAASVLLVSLVLIRAYDVLLAWYAKESRRGAKSGVTREFSPLLSRLGKIVIALLAVTAVLQHFGVNVQSLVVSLGVGSLAVGLAAQDTLANMFAGFTLMLDRPFMLGDRIQLSTGEVGDVEAIGMRATQLRTLDDTILIIPNSAIVKDRLVNQTRPTRRIACRIDVGVAYGSDVAVVKRILSESARSSEGTDREAAPVVLLTRFGEFTLDFRVVFWARDYLDQGLVTSEVREQIHRRFNEAGIEIPYPVRRVIQEAAGA